MNDRGGGVMLEGAGLEVFFFYLDNAQWGEEGLLLELFNYM